LLAETLLSLANAALCFLKTDVNFSVTAYIVSNHTKGLKQCERDALKQECRLACIACSGTWPPTHLSEKIQRARSYCLQLLLPV